MQFPLGKPILIMVALAVVAGGAVALRPATRAADLTFWVFADVHAETYRSIIAEFDRETGLTVDIQLLNGRAMPVRLQSLFMSDATDAAAVPDIVEVEIGWVGRFFRPPVHEVGLLPLNDYLRKDGWDRRILSQRFASWSKEGVIFGVPHDVHPVTISYRKDLFDEAGIELANAGTWTEFHEKCLRFQQYWRERGYPHRHAVELPQSSAEYVTVMLLQRGINLIDEREQIHFEDPRVAETIAFYAQLVAGDRRIGSESAAGAGVWTNDVVAGNLCAFLTPDWRVYSLKRYAPSLAGNMRMMPLPRFEPEDAATSTWGGTMIGITRNSTRHDDAWKLIEFLYLSKTGLRAHQQVSHILPAVIEFWDDPGYHQPDEYFGGQKVDELYIDLAHQIPRRYVTPASGIASSQLAMVLSRAVDHVKRHGPDGLEELCRVWCAQAAEDLRRRIEHGKIAP